MPIFTVTGDVDPFLHVSLRKGETIFCESDAMVMMEAPLDLTGSMQGGLVRAAMRRLANGESFFQQRIEAKRGDGDCLLAPNMPGGMQVLDVGARQYRMSDGAACKALAMRSSVALVGFSSVKRRAMDKSSSEGLARFLPSTSLPVRTL